MLPRLPIVADLVAVIGFAITATAGCLEMLQQLRYCLQLDLIEGRVRAHLQGRLVRRS